MKKYVKLLLFLPFLFSFQCKDNDPAPLDRLEETGLLGRWEIQDEVLNGVIADLLPRCCAFLVFKADDNISDKRGLLTYTANEIVKNGTFQVDESNQKIIFVDEDNDEFIFEFEFNEAKEQLIIDFIEEEVNYTQTWVKIE